LGLSAIIYLLAELINDPDREVQEVAIWALGQIGGDEARRILYACYEEGDPSLSEAVEEALEHLEFLYGFPDIPLDDLPEISEW
jgi:HEAT repeat protein